jgi:plastocyanin
MLETVILVNLALCFLFGTVLLNRKYDLGVIYGRESKSFVIVILVLFAFTLNMMPLVSAADSDGDGVEDDDDDCPDTVEQDGWSIADNGCSYPSYLDEVWLCIDGGVMVQDLTGNDDEECSIILSYDTTYMTVTTPGIANHDMEGGPGGEINSQDYSWKLPLVPVDDDDCDPEVSTDGCEMAPDRGPVATAINGVPFFGPEDGPGGDAVANHIGVYEEDRQDIALGVCGAHSGPGGSYHYHYDGNCMHWHGDSSNENHDVSITDDKDFSPEDLTINVGDTVVWTNNDDSPHTVTADDGQFNSGNMGEGATWSYTFAEAGTYGYHCNYHGSMTGSVTVVDPEIVWTDYDFSKIDSTSASSIIGFAFDGYPIYGAYGTVDGEVTLMRSNYVLKDGDTGYDGIDDYVYSADNGGHLDACNGIFSATPEFPDGIYHYHSTMPVEGNNPSANNAFPYFINCYRGIVESSNFDGGGGGDMPGPPDADGDGVGDGWDMCADTGDTVYPDGYPIYPRGCTEEQFSALSNEEQDAAKIAYAGDNPPAPPDDDGDGIPDPLDDCDDTEAGKLVYFDGCAHETTDNEEEENGGEGNGNTTDNETEESPDSDGDGIPDDDDVCPDENASGHDADADGCIDDSDNDGVKNDADACPFDPNDECLGTQEEENFPEDVPGCVHESAENYNSDATEDDGSCKYESDSPGFGFVLAALGCLIITFRRKL